MVGLGPASPSNKGSSTTMKSTTLPFHYPAGMPKSVHHILCSNKATAVRDLQHSHKKHIERLKNMKAAIDVAPSKGFKMNNAKKEQDTAERNATIERENKLLLSKMYSIMNSENPYLKIKVRPAAKSLNEGQRRRDYDRIARENQAIMQRILNRESSFDVRKQEIEWKQTQHYLKAIAQEPWVLDGLTPPRRKLKPLDSDSEPEESSATLALEPLAAEVAVAPAPVAAEPEAAAAEPGGAAAESEDAADAPAEAEAAAAEEAEKA